MIRHKRHLQYILVHLPLHQYHSSLEYLQVIYKKLQFTDIGANNSITKIQTLTLTKYDPWKLQEEKNVEAKSHTPTKIVTHQAHNEIPHLKMDKE